MKKMNIMDLKNPQEMTRDELIIEDMALRQRVELLQNMLNPEYDVFRDGSLDNILEICSWQDSKEKGAMKMSLNGTGRKSVKMLNDMSMQYKEYRKAFGEKPAPMEIKINLSAINELNKMNEG